MRTMGRAARDAARVLAHVPGDRKNGALWAMAEALAADAPAILAANARDVEAAKDKGPAFIDRLMLNDARLQAMAASVAAVTEIPDPVGSVVKSWTRPNGLRIEQIRVPIGVLGVIYESRPNVTADAAALCVKSGNAVILRSGSDALGSARAIHKALVKGLEKAGLPPACVSLVPVPDRDAVGLMLGGLDGAIDVIVPRGGKSLVARVQAEARVPVFAHLDGIVHVYVHADSDPAMARDIVLNAKMRRTGICGAAETLLIDRGFTQGAMLVRALLDAGCAVRGDDAVRGWDSRVTPASEDDWRSEYLDAIISVKVVDGMEAAIAHINTYGSHHTDAIVTRDEAAAARFLRAVDSAIVMHNASTQFADGGEFGFGAEIGIATGRLHARGPVGAEQLTTVQNVVHGTGQTRP
ncbi:MAG: glutamate-5-semialdehyde dehydrogenase [Rhodospirillales bacterium]|nr:glutamate-5-semialdehyde dehydrogenase [Alphaproteobacteria bacterium]MCB9987299.1 glutamate-5-semialdehyde dehydrogenase [Rhodospirillales bacterium]USO08542.1 MAG: glutamate-5-semialdehyde dehydrogenase [Rhodospirillales bacterium]